MVQHPFFSEQKRWRYGLAVVSALSVLSLARQAAAAEPTVDDVKAAEADFDAGREAYKAAEYVEAAEHFESADGHAPNEKVLELAISARDKAGHQDRAATLAQLGLETYPNSERLKKIAAPLVDKAHAELLQVTVECNEACTLLDGTRIVHGPPAERRIVFLTPGEHTIRAGWPAERTLSQNVTGNAGDTAQLTFTAPPVPKSDVGATRSTGTGEDSGAQSSMRVLPPLYFYIGAGATAVLGGVTIWSGIDTINNPGKDKVRAACSANMEPLCTNLYNQGTNSELRTNLLIAATSVVGAATAVAGIFFTDFSGKKKKPEDTVSVVPWISYGAGPAAGAMGRF
jgi:hypothetical protein